MRGLRTTPWPLVVAAGAAAPPLAFLALGHTLVWRDTGRLLAPVRGLVVEALRDLRLPLWARTRGWGSRSSPR